MLCSRFSSYESEFGISLLQHMKNYQKLLKKISSWLKPDGLLFVHIFVHKSIPYHFEVCTPEHFYSRIYFPPFFLLDVSAWSLCLSWLLR